MTPISLLSTASDVFSVTHNVPLLPQCYKSRKLSGRRSGRPSVLRDAGTDAGLRADADAGADAGADASPRVLELLYHTCTLQLDVQLCRYRRRAGVLAAGTGIRIRSTGRGVRHGRLPHAGYQWQ